MLQLGKTSHRVISESVCQKSPKNGPLEEQTFAGNPAFFEADVGDGDSRASDQLCRQTDSSHATGC